MKVFVLFTEETCHYDRSTFVEVFADKEKAKAAFDEFIAEWKVRAEKEDWEMDLSDDYFEAYPVGGYSEDSAIAKIEEKEVL